MSASTRPDEPTLGALVHDLSEQIPALIRSEIRLAQAEVTEKGKKLGTGVGMFGAAGYLGHLAVFTLLAVSVVKVFDTVVAMTQGGPGNASNVPAKFIMDHLFGRANLGLASAGAVMLLLTVLALVAPLAYARSRQKTQGGH